MNPRKAIGLTAAALSLGLLCWVATTGPANAQESIGGDLTPYLVGEFDFIAPVADVTVNAMENRYTIHNPTSGNLKYVGAPFDFAGAPSNIAGVTCWTGELKPNGGAFLAIAATLDFPDVFFGTFKIVSLDSLNEEARPAAGIVGFHERFMSVRRGRRVVVGSRSNLASIPGSVLDGGELEKIEAACAGAPISGFAADELTVIENDRVTISTNGDVIVKTP